MQYLLLFLLFSAVTFAQGRLDMTRTADGKTVEITENKRVRIVTNNGKVLKGRLRIIGDDKILVNKDTLNLSQVASVKRRPLGLTLAKTALISVAIFTLPVGSVLLFVYVKAAVTLVGIGAGSIATAVIMNNALPCRSSEKWNYKIIAESNP